MRKVIVLTFVSMDGVMQGPGGPDEDRSGGFQHGGWTVPYFDEFLGGVMDQQLARPFDLLLGRKTYDIFASYWPHQDNEANPGAAALNKATKYVASSSPLKPEWDKSVRLQGDVPAEIRKLKQGDGPELQVHGSSVLLQALLKHDLVDEFWLKIFPVSLGGGKRLFGEGSMPAAFTVQDSKVSPSGVLVASYARAGELKTGTFA